MSVPKGLIIGAVLGLLTTGISFGAEKSAFEQKEVKQFIQKMYSYDPDTFRYGEFSKSDGSPFLRNRVPKKNGEKYDPTKKCALLREFFDESIIEKRTIRPGLIQCDADYRYPNLYDEDASPATRSIDIPAPKIESLIVNANSAKVSVLTEGEGISRGRSLFFLTKTDNGWRVSNVMTQSRLPKPTDERDECYYSFAKKPSIEEFKEVAAPCRQSLPAEYRP